MTREKEIKEAARDNTIKFLDNHLDYRHGTVHQRMNLIKVRVDSREKAFIEGAKWADRTLIDKALDWLINESNDGRIHIRNHEEFEKQFRKAMEE